MLGTSTQSGTDGQLVTTCLCHRIQVVEPNVHWMNFSPSSMLFRMHWKGTKNGAVSAQRRPILGCGWGEYPSCEPWLV